MSALLLALVVIFVGGVAAFLLRGAPRAASAVGAVSAVAGALLGLGPCFGVLLGGARLSFAGPWPMPNGALLLEVDALAAFFLVPIFVIAALGSVYGSGYLAHEPRQGAAAAGFNLLVVSMALMVMAANGVLFLVAWEAMAVAAFFLVAFDHHLAEARRAAWVYVIFAHVGAAVLFAMFMVLANGAGSYDFEAFARHPPEGARAAAVIALGLVGFSTKAGFFPLHVWLPEAHAAAPSHVSALMSGVLIKMGLYGILRLSVLLGPRVWAFGLPLAAVGMVSAVVAIALALAQRDLKRALAYSTVENVGLIGLGIGVSWEASAHGAPRVAAVAMTGALFHLWNHALMKGTMFLGAGSVVHATGTRDLERHGGLLRAMPATGAAMVVGAVALSALPPLNGFVSEWLLYQAMLERGLMGHDAGAALSLVGIGAVALTGGLAALSFTRLVGIALLGHPRSPGAAKAHEGGARLTGPLALLAAGCVGAAFVPAPLLESLTTVAGLVLSADVGPSVVSTPVDQIARVDLALWGLLAVAAALTVWLLRAGPTARAQTWGCGYAGDAPRTQYGARSFSELVSEQVLPKALRPTVARRGPEGLFPAPGRLAAELPDPVTHRVYEPMVWWWARRLASFSWLQRGELTWYLVFVLAAVLLGMGWLFLREWVT